MWGTPWVVGGGAEHSPEVARVLAYAATSGAGGVIGVNDLRVQATATPTTQVRVSPGAAIIRNRYAGGGQQSYIAHNGDEDLVDVTPTGSSSGRVDLVVARVEDPQYAGPIPADPTDHNYAFPHIITGVPAGTTRASELGLGYPAEELARLDLPANTATITPAMVTDLRKVANPRRDRELFAHNLEGPTVYALESDTPVAWPGIAESVFMTYVPEWATVAMVKVTLGGVRVSRSAATGVWWARIGRPEDWGEGNVRTQDQKYALDFSAVSGVEMRESWSAGDDINIPAAMRGTMQPIRIFGKRLTTGGPPRLDNASSIMLDVEYKEKVA